MSADRAAGKAAPATGQRVSGSAGSTGSQMAGMTVAAVVVVVSLSVALVHSVTSSGTTGPAGHTGTLGIAIPNTFVNAIEVGPPPRVVTVTTTPIVTAPFPTQVTTTSAPSPLEQVRTARLTATGLGPIQVGMHVDEIESSLRTDVDWGWDFAPEDSDGDGCGYAGVPVLDDMGLMMMIGGPEPRVTRIEIWGPSDYDTTQVNPVTKTNAGVGIGSTEADVLEAYGAEAVFIAQHAYQDGHYMSVSVSGGHLLLFETDGSRVTAMRTGDEDWVSLNEYCA